MATVIMYEMPTCAHCMRARAAIARYNGPVKFTIKNFSEAPNGVGGFPFFVASNGKQLSGYGGSVESLIKQLGLQENFHMNGTSNGGATRDMFIGVR